ncbi:MAG: TIGR03086 family metal-binding protein [Micromonosporaceae bacterium]
MSHTRATAPLLGGVALLERAINYTLGSLRLVTPDALSYRTPCREWDLDDLLGHMDDSLAALCEAIDLGHVALDHPTDSDLADVGVDRVRSLRNRACRLLGAWNSAGAQDDLISVAGCPITAGIVGTAGAVEVAVHGWDVARACGADRPIPAPLAEQMLELVPLLVTEQDRPGRFAPQVDVSPGAVAGDRLLAFLGRDPAAPG